MLRVICIFSAIFLCFSARCFSQSNYLKNDYVKTNCVQKGNNYVFSLTFKDHNSETRRMSIKFSKSKTEEIEAVFGLPESCLTDDGGIQLPKEEIIAKGFRYVDDHEIAVDYSKLINNYSELICKPIARNIVRFLRSKKIDNRDNRINLAMALVQDIPYGIPPPIQNGKYRGGCSSPAQVLINGYGDCDSKGALFAGIASYLISREDIYLVMLSKNVDQESGHFVTAIKSNNTDGKSYYMHKGQKMVVVETAGPAKKKFGKRSRMMPFLKQFEQLQEVY